MSQNESKLPYLFTDDQITKEFIKYKWLQWKVDPYRWLVEQVWTQDESKMSDKVQLFPHKEYIQLLIEEIYSNKVLVVDKARRMMATYINTALCLHQIIFEPYSEVVAVSIDQRATQNLIQKRAIPMYKRLDKRFPYPELKDKEHLQKTKIINPHSESTFEAYPSGADKVRGLTLTYGFFDEFAFQKNCEENLRALRPALEGEACRAVISSTPKMGTMFQKLVTDRAKDAQYRDIRQGMSSFLNSQNDRVLTLHYSADPRKDPNTDEGNIWYHRERFGTTPDGIIIPGASAKTEFEWNQEYELMFSVPIGKPVFSQFDESLHCGPYKAFGGYIAEKPLLAGVDFGGHYPVMTISQKDTLNREIVHGAWMAEDEELQTFMIRMRDIIAEEFGAEALKNMMLFCDPAGARVNGQGTAPPAAELLGQFFKRPVRWPGFPKILTTKPIDRCRAIDNKMSKKTHNTMGVIMNPSAGTFFMKDGTVIRGLLVDALKFGYVFKAPKSGHEHYTTLEPKKDGLYDHMIDAWGYQFYCTSPLTKEIGYEGAEQPRQSSSVSRNKRRQLRL